jgi:hypothetical protein
MGARTREQLAEIPVALGLELSAEDRDRIETEIPPAAIVGARYQEVQMRQLDSER